MKKEVLVVIILLTVLQVNAQILKPVRWGYAAKKTSPTEAVLLMKATIDKGWHIYSQHIKDNEAVQTNFTFLPAPTYALINKTQEPKPITKLEKILDMEVSYFEEAVVFQQKIKLKSNAPILVKGNVAYISCNDQKHVCLPLDEVDFTIPVK
ncbi:hypothetical protein GCM10028805_41660 [Spirosoma harenae]